MKKLVIASILATTAAAVSATEVGVTAARDYAGTDRGAYGVTFGQTVGPVLLTAGVDRTQTGVDQTRYSLVAGYDVYKVGPVTLSVKGGVAYLDNAKGADGSALLVGAGASMPVVKNVAATLDLTHQYGQDRVQAFDGNRVTVGLKYSF